MIFHLGELFCGPGGIGWGATHADIGNEEFGIVHQWANDFDESTCRTYTRNICPDAPESVYCEDVHTLDLTQLGAIDALAFGFPCNDFSLVGSKLISITCSMSLKPVAIICDNEKWNILFRISFSAGDFFCNRKLGFKPVTRFSLASWCGIANIYI